MKVIVDRINDNKITLELEDKTVAVMDLKIFPNAKEGDVLLICKENEKTEKRREKVEKLINNFFEE